MNQPVRSVVRLTQRRKGGEILKRGIAYTRGKKGGPGALISSRDFQVLQQKGYVTCPDMERIPAEHVVLEVDQDGMQARIIGAALDSEHVMKVANEARRNSSYLIRPEDLTDKAGIARKTGRSRSVVTEHWSKHPNFPRPVLNIGGHEAYYWPDVVDWIRSRNLPLRKKPGEKVLGAKRKSRKAGTR